MELSDRQKEALELLNDEEFYLQELSAWNFWKAFSSNKHIKTNTMKSLSKRGLVDIKHEVTRYGTAIAKIRRA